MKAGRGLVFGPDQRELWSWFWWRGGWASTRWKHLDSSLTCKYHFLHFIAHALTDEWTLASFLQLPLAKSSLLASDPSTRRKEGAQHSRASLAHSLARGSGSTGTSQLLLGRSGCRGLILYCQVVYYLVFLKPILFVFNIVIFCLMLYYSYGYYSFISLQ